MFVRTQGVAVATIGALALGGCDSPSQRTDLRPEGDPEVLAVLVMSDAAGGLIESATYCAVGDEKRPGLVGLPDFSSIQVCDDDLSKPADEVTTAAPEGWYVRVMFDELLNPDTVEDLVPVLDDQGMETGAFSGTIAAKNPVTLKCQSSTGAGLVTIPYDGYYSPSGNNVTWPLGPSIVIKPADPSLLATDSECEVTLNDSIKDK